MNNIVARKQIAIILFVALCSQFFFYKSAQAKITFSDAATSPYIESIEYLAEKGMVSGTPDGSFKPDAIMTRAEFITVIVRAFGPTKEIGTRSECFSDVHTEWFARFICYAKGHSMVSGHPDGTFKPGGNVSYAEAVAMAVAGAKIKIEKDTAKNWFEPFIEFAHINNIFSKYSMLQGTPLTRAKAAFIIHQILLIKSGEKAQSTVRKNYSAGCSVSPPSVPPTSINVDGITRNMISVVPKTYSKDTPIKLVFAVHGRTNSNTMVRGYYKVEEAAAGASIFIYPSALKSGTSYTWSEKDFPFFDSLLTKFSNEYCIDLDQVYVVGHSLGGWMTSELACKRGDVIRGIANIGGGATRHASCSGPVSAMIWHNPKDNLVPYSAGIIARDAIRAQNQIGPNTIPTKPLWANCVSYTDDKPDAQLTWCPHTEDYEYYGSKQFYPHLWPKNAGQEIWKFFEGL